MLQFFTGRSGSGKTEEIHHRIQSEEHLEKVILIIPDQSTFQNEKKILNYLGAKRASKIQVYGFKRLYERLEAEYGENAKKSVSDGVKAVLMSIAAEQVSEQLSLYANRVNKADFAELMLSVVNEYKSCSVSPERLLEAAEKVSDERLKEKLKESAIVYAAYDAVLNQSYSNPDDDLTRLYEILCRHDVFTGKRVYFDSFNSFSGQEYKVVQAIIEQADYTGISLGCDDRQTGKLENSIFKEPYMTMKKLSAFAEERRIGSLPPVVLTGQKRFHTPSLRAVEESIFRFNGKSYQGTDDSVRLYEAEDEYDEIRQTARGICALVRNEDYAYRDITVICREPERYRYIIESEFPKYEIPFFMSDKKPLEGNSLIKLILSAFDTIHSSYATENIFTFLKTELTDLLPSEICTLENYAYMWDIRGKRWTKEFTMDPDGDMMKKPSENDEKLSEIEKMRRKVMEPLMHFAGKLKNAANGGEISVAVYELLDELNVQNSLRYLTACLEEQGSIKAKETEARIWDITMDILDKMYHILKDNAVGSKRYAELLKLMIRNSPISDIPQTLDQVTIGRAGNIIAESPKAVFLIGAMEGSFPAAPTSSGFFSDGERNELLALELPLHHSVYDMALLEKYNAYTALSEPSEKLFISCHTANVKGENFKPSVIFTEVQSILKNVVVRKRDMLSDEELFFTPKQSFEECAALWNENTPKANALRQYFSESEDFKDNCDAIRRCISDEPYTIRNKEYARAVFGGNQIRVSASQTELYYSCPFAYFCRYGLKAYPRKQVSMDASTYGSVVHYILEQIIGNEDFDTLKNSSTDRITELVGKYVRKYVEMIGEGAENTERFTAQFAVIERNLAVVLKRLIDEFSVSKFIPADVELNIGGANADIPAYELELPTGEKISLTGKIDRVDTYVADGKKYIRIVDYKTGTKNFRLSDVYYGLNMQMLLYLSAIEKNGRQRYSENDRYKLLPAGILYMPAAPKPKSEPFRSEETLKDSMKELQKNFKMNGLLINDEKILSAMEEGIQGLFIPSGADSLVSLEEYGKIFSYIDSKLKEMAQALFDGRVERNPVKMAADACQYCDYKTVCGFEDGKRFKAVWNDSSAETLKKMGENKNNG